MAKETKKTKKKVGVETSAEPRKIKKVVERTLQDDHSASADGGWVDLNFKVKREFRKYYKKTAANHGMSMKELLEASLKTWLRDNGHRPPSDDDDDTPPKG